MLILVSNNITEFISYTYTYAHTYIRIYLYNIKIISED